MKDVHYQKLEMQSYLKNGRFNQEEIKLLFSLRSKSYPAKINYKKINKGNLKCTFQCKSDETQEHIFQNCQPILSRISYPVIINLSDIYGSVDDQYSIIKNLTEVDRMRRLMKEEPYL